MKTKEIKHICKQHRPTSQKKQETFNVIVNLFEKKKEFFCRTRVCFVKFASCAFFLFFPTLNKRPVIEKWF